MMEYKFRGKTEDGEWVYGVPVQTRYSDLATMVIDITEDEIISELVIPKTVGQYTGLKDKNGKEIYDGDKLDELRDGFKLTVEWNSSHATFLLVEELAGANFFFEFIGAPDNVEITGNIHD